jgi:hypothetical protein
MWHSFANNAVEQNESHHAAEVGQEHNCADSNHGEQYHQSGKRARVMR